METPTWIRPDVVRAIHHRQLSEHGGLAAIRDEGLLASALARPRDMLAYDADNTDIARLAAAYAFGISRNHPFIDGNKRVSYVVCRTFLVTNGVDIDATQGEKYTTFMALAAGTLSEDQLTEWIRARLVARS